ncbi:hypothetical protein [Saccharomonospora piscinae]|uniref:hypothetical protein n=1 Tax=Saccharomonospora piscinae TaxID=687388 RepID=UPI000463713A|nr:hypothetical protein [Saccharomonospora piscinae]
MVDVHEGLPKDGFAVPLRLHNVLLALAGRLDDSALSEARELVARSHLDDAAELAAGALIAGRIMVRPSEQRELALVLEMSRSDAALAESLTVGDSVPGYTHRFSRDNEPEAGVAEALDRTLQVLPDVRSVHAVWRNTPAGSVPGPLPQRVVLIEIGPEAHPPAVAFRVDDALRRGGIRAVVEVTGPSAERSDYHEAALATAAPVWLASGTSGGDQGGKPRPRQRKITAGAARARADSLDARESGSVEIPPAREESPRSFAPAESGTVPEPPAPAESAEFSESSESAAHAESPAPVETGNNGHGAGGVDAQSFSADELAELENRVAETTEMSAAEVAQLRAAIAEDPERGRAMAGLSANMADLPALDLDDPQLSERDRQLLRELHAELAERERAEAARTNGAERRWGDGSSGE